MQSFEEYYLFCCYVICRNNSTAVTEVEPYIPFNINPDGMQPVFTTTYLLAFPSIMARFTHWHFSSKLYQSLSLSVTLFFIKLNLEIDLCNCHINVVLLSSSPN